MVQISVYGYPNKVMALNGSWSGLVQVLYLFHLDAVVVVIVMVVWFILALCGSDRWIRGSQWFSWKLVWFKLVFVPTCGHWFGFGSDE